MNIFPCEILRVVNGFIYRPGKNNYNMDSPTISETYVFISLEQLFEWMKDQHEKEIKESGTFCPDIK